MAQEIDFDQWYDIALGIYNRTFKGLPLDRDAAQYAYNVEKSPEEYIEELICDSLDGL